MEDYIKAHSAKMSGFEVLLSSELSAVEKVILLSLWICRALRYYFSDEFKACADTSIPVRPKV